MQILSGAQRRLQPFYSASRLPSGALLLPQFAQAPLRASSAAVHLVHSLAYGTSQCQLQQAQLQQTQQPRSTSCASVKTSTSPFHHLFTLKAHLIPLDALLVTGICSLHSLAVKALEPIHSACRNLPLLALGLAVLFLSTPSAAHASTAVPHSGANDAATAAGERRNSGQGASTSAGSKGGCFQMERRRAQGAFEQHAGYPQGLQLQQAKNSTYSSSGHGSIQMSDALAATAAIAVLTPPAASIPNIPPSSFSSSTSSSLPYPSCASLDPKQQPHQACNRTHFCNPMAATAEVTGTSTSPTPLALNEVDDSVAASADAASIPSQLPPASPPPPPPQPLGGAELLMQEDAAVNALFRNAQPSVVNVSGARMATTFSTLDVTRPSPGQGSGFLWDGRGHVVTAYSLVRGAAEVKVTLVDASSYTARVVGWDAGKDVAVLRLSIPKSKLKELKPAKLPPTPADVPGTVVGAAPLEGLVVGQTVFAVGNATGLDHTLTRGCVSGLGRELPGSSASPAGLPMRGLIQVDAPCSHQAGGVLLNAQGTVMGMVAHPCSSASLPAGCGLGYAVPINALRGLVDQIILAPVSLAGGRGVGSMGTAKPSRPTLGVTLAPPQVLAALKQEGVLVLEVPPGSPGIAAGLRHTHRDIFGDVILGDVIVGLDGKSVRSSVDLFNALDARRAGDRVRLDILRDGRATSLTVVLGERGAAGILEE